MSVKSAMLALLMAKTIGNELEMALPNGKRRTISAYQRVERNQTKPMIVTMKRPATM
ncbi:hypothetical protein [Saccharothrix sp. HUAS TT1]|uniref:hypothetical protein n=1 Tax=unclassified Saccharothrix TaxID=2593673 RepID=UPI00345C3892